MQPSKQNRRRAGLMLAAALVLFGAGAGAGAAIQYRVSNEQMDRTLRFMEADAAADQPNRNFVIAKTTHDDVIQEIARYGSNDERLTRLAQATNQYVKTFFAASDALDAQLDAFADMVGSDK